VSDRLDLVRLARAEGVGPVTYRRLLARFGDAAAALDALPTVARRGGAGSAPRVPEAGEIAREAEELDRLGGRFLLLDEPDYPPALAALDDAPPVLAVLGRVELLRARSVAIVGARNASANGRRFAEALAAELALAGIVVVSGLARGIDTAAHNGALMRGATIAAIAGGLDRPYPAENEPLQRAIVDRGGAVVAEQKLGTVPTNRHFPRRNRIIAGLSLGCVVVEAAPHSGSLITANIARDNGRELFAVPGSPLDPRSRGSNQLLRDGAHVCESAADILADLPQAPGTAPMFAAPRVRPRPAAVAAPPPPDPVTVADVVLGLLGAAPTGIDDLVRNCQFSAALVSAALTELELDGRVELLPGSRACLRSER
jgi:DNA processing protein